MRTLCCFSNNEYSVISLYFRCLWTNFLFHHLDKTVVVFVSIRVETTNGFEMAHRRRKAGRSRGLRITEKSPGTEESEGVIDDGDCRNPQYREVKKAQDHSATCSHTQ